MEKTAFWRLVHDERRALAAVLARLTPEQWEADTLCAGWAVRDVAAHVISAPQLRLRDMWGPMVRSRGDLNRMIFLDVKRRGQAPVERILGDFEVYDGSTFRFPGSYPLTDVAIHTQDILRPLGLRHDMPVEAALDAARLCLKKPALMGTKDLIASVRLVATDVDWSHGTGPEIRGPIQELAMLTAGRHPDTTLLEGDGQARLANR